MFQFVNFVSLENVTFSI